MATPAALGAKIKKLITKYGVALTLTRKTGGAYDPTTLGPSTPGTQTYSCVGLPQSYSMRASAFDDEFKAQGTVFTEVRKVMIPASGLNTKPQAGDTLGLIEGYSWRVLGVTTESFQGVGLMYSVKVVR